MKDIPLFSTQNGVASLTLKEVPYSKKAYIRIQSALDAEQLLTDCVAFCRAIGAEEIYATGDTVLEKYPVHTEIVKMAGKLDVTEVRNAKALPLITADITFFRETYNEKMAAVPNSSYMSQADAVKLLADAQGYIIELNCERIGIGIAGDGMIKMLATTVSGTGRTVLNALASELPNEEIMLEVATENERAMQLYLRAGYRVIEHIATWYKIL